MGLGQLAEPVRLDGVRLVPLPDFESSFGTETLRVRIADWSSARNQLPHEEETRPESRKNKNHF
jgi:hypothetical protein